MQLICPKPEKVTGTGRNTCTTVEQVQLLSSTVSTEPCERILNLQQLQRTLLTHMQAVTSLWSTTTTITAHYSVEVQCSYLQLPLQSVLL